MIGQVIGYAGLLLALLIAVHGTLDKIRSGKAHYRVGPNGPWYADRDEDKFAYWASVGIGGFVWFLLIAIGLWGFYDLFLRA